MIRNFATAKKLFQLYYIKLNANKLSNKRQHLEKVFFLFKYINLFDNVVYF